MLDNNIHDQRMYLEIRHQCILYEQSETIAEAVGTDRNMKDSCSQGSLRISVHVDQYIDPLGYTELENVSMKPVIVKHTYFQFIKVYNVYEGIKSKPTSYLSQSL